MIFISSITPPFSFAIHACTYVHGHTLSTPKNEIVPSSFRFLLDMMTFPYNFLFFRQGNDAQLLFLLLTVEKYFYNQWKLFMELLECLLINSAFLMDIL